MKIGALIVTTGLPNVSGVAALLPDVGSISAGQRMISVFQRAGVCVTALVVGPEDRKIDRQFSQPGVIFLRCRQGASFLEGVRAGLGYMAEKYDCVFVVPGDMSLFLPRTLEALLESTGPAAVPVHRYIHGYPLLLSRAAMEAVLNAEAEDSLEEILTAGGLAPEYIVVEDSGILLRSADMSHRQELLSLQNRQLARPVLDISLQNGNLLYDTRLSMLLHLVEETGSVRDACALMQISYSAAWNMLNHAEEELGYPLVVRKRGGAVGSGSVLTEKGNRLMEAYDRFSEDLSSAARSLYDDFLSAFPQLDI